MIFNLFESKPTLKDLIPEGFVDIHSHILPGIDDGSKTVDESLELIDEMNNFGFTKIIGTPHTYQGIYNNTNASIKESYLKLSKSLNTKTKIDYASEYMLDDTIIEKAKKKELLCLKDKYVLVEMSFISPPINLYEIIFELQINEYRPVLAHPERYNFLHNKFDEYYKLKKHGCLFQLNLLSNTYYYGKEITLVTEKLLNNNLIDFVGSDIHSTKHIKYFEKNIEIKNLNKLKKAVENNKFFD